MRNSCLQCVFPGLQRFLQMIVAEGAFCPRIKCSKRLNSNKGTKSDMEVCQNRIPIVDGEKSIR